MALKFEYPETVNARTAKYADLNVIRHEINKLLESGNRFLRFTGFDSTAMAYQTKLWNWQKKGLIPDNDVVVIHREGNNYIIIENLNWRKDV